MQLSHPDQSCPQPLARALRILQAWQAQARLLQLIASYFVADQRLDHRDLGRREHRKRCDAAGGLGPLAKHVRYLPRQDQPQMPLGRLVARRWDRAVIPTARSHLT